MLCLVYVRVFMGGTEQNGVANSDFVVCLSLELQQIECVLMHDANNLYVTEDRGHIPIIHGLNSSYGTPLFVKPNGGWKS